MRYGAAANRIWLGYGGGGLAEVDSPTAKMLARIRLSAHPESFQLERSGGRIYVAVPHRGGQRAEIRVYAARP